MSKFKRTGYYCTRTGEFAFTIAEAFEYFLKIFIEKYRKGEEMVKLPEEEFKGLNYENIITWAASIQAEGYAKRAEDKLSIWVDGIFYNFYEEDADLEEGWVNLADGGRIECKYTRDGIQGFLSNMCGSLEDVLELYHRFDVPSPDIGTICTILTESADECYTDDGDFIEYCDKDSIISDLLLNVAEVMFRNEVKELDIRGKIWKYGPMLEILAEAKKE